MQDVIPPMITNSVIFTTVLIVIICLLTLTSKKIKVAYPILLVLAGLAISFLPNMPRFHVNPELIFIIFLPPLLYEAAISSSWKELWRWRRIISGFAFIVVFVTACAVALVANAIIPGFSIALGFLLGGIVSPPDAVSAQAIMGFVKVPKRIASVLEGESLFNDASSLIIMRFALIAIGTGQFVWYEATLSFVWMIVGGVAIGVLVGWLMMKAHRVLPVDVNVDVVFTLIAPYIMYIAAEEAGASGVISVVAGGLFMNTHSVLIYDGTARLSGANVWSNFGFLLNGFVFILIGLELPEITTAICDDGIGMGKATLYGLLITVALIVVRMICAYGALLVTMVMRHVIHVADPKYYGLKAPILLGWTGMRGVVSLAAALSIPLTVSSTGGAFPQRSLIIYITFIVILVTLLLQGLTLPMIIKRTKFPDFHDHLPLVDTERLIRKGLAEESLRYLKERGEDNGKAGSQLLDTFVRHWQQQLDDEQDTAPLYGDAARTYYEVLERQRVYLYNLNRSHSEIDESIIRRFIHRIDLEEERIKND